MNNEFKYGVQGMLLSIGFFATLQLGNFLYSISPKFILRKEVTSYDGELSTSQPVIVSLNQKGKALFSQNCAACHAVHKNLTGPALAGVEERVPDKKILYQWIRNNQQVLKSGNDYFNKLYKDYNKTQMNIFSNLSDNDIDDILEYIKQK